MYFVKHSEGCAFFCSMMFGINYNLIHEIENSNIEMPFCKKKRGITLCPHHDLKL